MQRDGNSRRLIRSTQVIRSSPITSSFSMAAGGSFKDHQTTSHKQSTGYCDHGQFSSILPNHSISVTAAAADDDNNAIANAKSCAEQFPHVLRDRREKRNGVSHAGFAALDRRSRGA